MKKKILHIALTFFAGFMVTMGSVQAVSAENQDADSLFVVELINLIRMDPVSYAAGLGYDGEALLAERPWLAELVENKLPLLSLSDSLNAKAALVNNADFIEPLPQSVMADDYARTGEVSGVVSFYNFMDPKNAVRIVVNSQFKRELDSAFQGQRCILSADLDLAGAAFEAGRTVVGNEVDNAYYVTALLGSSLLKSQRQILNLINQIRANPLAVNGDLSVVLNNNQGGYRPLFFNEVLSRFVKTEFVDTDYYAVHAENFGYQGDGLGKRSSIDVFSKTSPDEMVLGIFSSLVANEARDFKMGSVMFGTYYNEVGVNLAISSGTEFDYARLTLIAGLGETDNPGYSRIYGLVHVDGDLNDTYTPGEGAKKRIVSIYDQETLVPAGTAVTDNTGHFSVTLLSNRNYIVQTITGESPAVTDIFLDRDRFLVLKTDR